MTVEKRYKPKVVQPSARATRKQERKDIREVERVRRLVEAAGGEAALHSRVEAVAASHGATYGRLRMPGKKLTTLKLILKMKYLCAKLNLTGEQ